MDSSVWITGAHGFIGRHLSRSLFLKNYRVAGIGHGAWPRVEREKWGISAWIDGEISASNLRQMQQVTGVPDRVYHLAGGSSVGSAFAGPYEDFTRTVVSTAELLEWLRQNAPDTKIIAVSSAAVYGAGHLEKIKEDVQLNPFSPYGTHKLMMETLCRSYAANFGLRVVLPRLFSVYGAELKKQLLWDLCGKFAADGTVELGGTGEELRDWTDVRDVVQALDHVAFVADDQAPVLNIATGHAIPVKAIASMVAFYWGGKSAVSRIVFNGQSRQGDPFSLVADIDRMRAFKIKCSISADQGIGEYVAWYRSLSGEAL